MIVFKKNSEIDYERWDQCIHDAEPCLPYVFSSYLDIVAPEWDALIMEDYSAVMPLPNRKKLGMSYCFQPKFVQQLGLFTSEKIDSSLMESFLQKIPKIYLRVHFNLNSSNAIEKPYRLHQNYVLDLVNPYEDVKKNYSSNHKRNINKAQKSDLRLTKETVDATSIIELFRNDKGKEIGTLNEGDYAILHQLITHHLDEKKGFIWGVENEKSKLLCAAFMVQVRGRLVFLFSGNSIEGKEKRAMFFLIDSLIKHFSGQQMLLDFEGSNDESLALFYERFGSTKEMYAEFKKGI